jgi:hypothetical protein
MSTILRPAGSQPARVYWIRRAVVFGALLLVLVMAVSALSRCGRSEGATDDEAAAVQPGPTAEEIESGSDSSRACEAADLTLVVTTDAPTYGADSTPVFSVTITNTSDSSCTVDAGDASRELLVTSGSDRIWSSLDCVDEAEERMLLLPVGGSDGPTPVTWQRVRSDETCGEGLPDPRAGTYHVVAKLAGAESQEATFSLR